MIVLARILQCTWCLPQTLVGAGFFLYYRHCRRFSFRTSIVVEWPRLAGLSLGLFIFVPMEAPGRYLRPGPPRRLLAHEYGHALQSFLLGPLYLPAVVLPSLLWAGTKRAARYRTRTGTSYYSHYPENWANWLSNRVTGEQTPN